MSESANVKRVRPKVAVGILLLILTPVGLFVKPATGNAIVRDLFLVIWWAFVIWLLVTGFKEPKPTKPIQLLRNRHYTIFRPVSKTQM